MHKRGLSTTHRKWCYSLSIILSFADRTEVFATILHLQYTICAPNAAHRSVAVIACESASSSGSASRGMGRRKKRANEIPIRGRCFVPLRITCSAKRGGEGERERDKEGRDNSSPPLCHLCTGLVLSVCTLRFRQQWCFLHVKATKEQAKVTTWRYLL